MATPRGMYNSLTTVVTSVPSRFAVRMESLSSSQKNTTDAGRGDAKKVNSIAAQTTPAALRIVRILSVKGAYPSKTIGHNDCDSRKMAFQAPGRQNKRSLARLISTLPPSYSRELARLAERSRHSGFGRHRPVRLEVPASGAACRGWLRPRLSAGSLVSFPLGRRVTRVRSTQGGAAAPLTLGYSRSPLTGLPEPQRTCEAVPMQVLKTITEEETGLLDEALLDLLAVGRT